MDKQKKSGGARSGAGRKAHEVKKELFRVTPEEKEMILKLRKSEPSAKPSAIPKRIEKAVSENKLLKKSLKELLNEIK